jgi:hypothetical protein
MNEATNVKGKGEQHKKKEEYKGKGEGHLRRGERVAAEAVMFI